MLDAAAGLDAVLRALMAKGVDKSVAQQADGIAKNLKQFRTITAKKKK